MSEKKFPFEFKERTPLDIERQRLIDELTRQVQSVPVQPPLGKPPAYYSLLTFDEMLKRLRVSLDEEFKLPKIIGLSGIEDTLKPRDK